MKVYTYSEYNGCKNTGKPVFLCNSSEYRQMLCEENLTAVIGNGLVGDFFGTTICLGYFDGVHLAHKALFDVAKSQGEWGVLLFDKNVKNMPLLTTMQEKIRLIEDAGADYVVIADFSEKFMSRTPLEFADFLKNTLKVSGVVAGFDYRFGKNAQGDAILLKELSGEFGFSANIVEAKYLDEEPIKSTKIRDLIKSGDVLSANKFLGYLYIVSGVVEKGFGNGHKLGFPTANIAYDDEKLLPPDGVYAGRVLEKNAVINIGKNPTFEAKRRTVEVHILDFDGDLYGKHIEAEFLEKIRDDIKFEKLEDLIERIKKDIEFVKGR